MGVKTSKGEIPFKEVKVGALVFYAPVRIGIFTREGPHDPVPLMDAEGRYIYALPGGMYLLPDNTVFDPNTSVLG